MSNANVTHFVPPPPPGPATYDRSGFRNGGTVLLDSSNLAVNANLVSTCRLKVYGDPANPLAPTISAPSIATNLLFAPSFDAANNVQFRTAVAISNNFVQVVKPAVMSNVTIGSQFTWTPPTYSSILPVVPKLNGTTFGQTYPLVGGQLVGYAPMFVPQPPLATQGTLINLNGGALKGTATLFH